MPETTSGLVLQEKTLLIGLPKLTEMEPRLFGIDKYCRDCLHQVCSHGDVMCRIGTFFPFAKLGVATT